MSIVSGIARTTPPRSMIAPSPTEAAHGADQSQGGRRPRDATCDDPGVSVQGHAPVWIDLDGAVNARVVVPGVLLRADNLQSLSARDEAAVRIEHRSLYPDSGGNTDLEADTIKPWGPGDERQAPDESPVVQAYMSYLRRRPDSVVGTMRTIARADGAVLVHCAAGKDRTGVLVALALDAAGVDREGIIGDYLATGQRIDAIVARLVSSSTYRAELEGHDPQQHAPTVGTMERVLELVDEQFGGSAAWLAAYGLDNADLEQLRGRLGSPDRVPR
jgi:protein-tyrosine phosphatase